MAMSFTYEKMNGFFKEKEFGASFEYFDGVHPDLNLVEGATHTLISADIHFPYRACRILKTVAYVCIDEDESGMVWQKWNIKNHTRYTA